MKMRALVLLAIPIALAACVDGTTPDCSKVACGPDFDGAAGEAGGDGAPNDAPHDAPADAPTDGGSDAPSDAPAKG